MVMFLQNHDQIANSGRGLRIHQLASPGIARALAALLLLSPGTPLLFQGEEFAASTPFLFFADHKPELAKMVRQGRAEFLSQWRRLATGQLKFDDPCSQDTFKKCKLDLSERDKNQQWVAFYKDLIEFRKKQNVFSRQDRNFDGAVLSTNCFVLRFGSGNPTEDRLVLVNLGRDLNFSPSPEPLLAPPECCEWKILWSSEHPKYGGEGTPPLDSDLNWMIPGRSTVVLSASPMEKGSKAS
jgi:maltooligosyltrehalose trehalohydrolase